MLFLQHVIDALKPGGRCGMVIDEGVLFRTTETAFVQTKRKLLDDCDLWCIVSLPPGVFSSAGAGVKTNLLFFTKGGPTERIWYYDLSDVKVTKKQPLTLDRFDGVLRARCRRGPTRARSWTVTREELEARRLRPQGGQPHREGGRRHADAAGAPRRDRGPRPRGGRRGVARLRRLLADDAR